MIHTNAQLLWYAAQKRSMPFFFATTSTIPSKVYRVANIKNSRGFRPQIENKTAFMPNKKYTYYYWHHNRQVGKIK